MKDIITLSIESSCDETAVAVLKNGREVLANVVSTQIELHKKFGGVVPEVASRKHIENIDAVYQEALDAAGIKPEEIDHIAVTYGPGLVGALLVGLSYAKALAFTLGVPIVGVNHMQGHINANYIQHKYLKPPFITLVVSGGHTHLVEVKDYQNYEILGRTRDDASGEAFDKIPRAFLDDSYDFSFSGLKSAVLNYLNAQKMKKQEIVVEDVAASFQEAVVEVLATKAVHAAEEKGYKTIALSGGVAANSALRDKITKMAGEKGIEIKFPSIELCTDNAAMIGCAGYHNFINGKIDDMSLNAVPNLKIDVN